MSRDYYVQFEIERDTCVVETTDLSRTTHALRQWGVNIARAFGGDDRLCINGEMNLGGGLEPEAFHCMLNEEFGERKIVSRWINLDWPQWDCERDDWEIAELEAEEAEWEED